MSIFFETLKNRKMSIIWVVLVILGITLIFSQYFGLFPLDDKYALDMLMYYSQDTFFNVLDSMDSASRTSYLMIHLADYFFMFGFYQLIALGIYRLTPKDTKLLFVVVIPYIAFLGDFLENIIMDLHLLIYPNQINFLGYLSGVFSFIKFISMYLALIILFLLAIYCITKKSIKKRSQ